MLTLKELNEVFDKEIEWSKNENNIKTSGITFEQAKWFIRGLEQAKRLIKELEINK